MCAQKRRYGGGRDQAFLMLPGRAHGIKANPRQERAAPGLFVQPLTQSRANGEVLSGSLESCSPHCCDFSVVVLTSTRKHAASLG